MAIQLRGVVVSGNDTFKTIQNSVNPNPGDFFGRFIKTIITTITPIKKITVQTKLDESTAISSRKMYYSNHTDVCSKPCVGYTKINSLYTASNMNLGEIYGWNIFKMLIINKIDKNARGSK
jgi:hypothetical protein